jgi:hypothetical protein
VEGLPDLGTTGEHGKPGDQKKEDQN